MGITLYWNEDQTILHHIYAGIWTEHDFIACMNTSHEWLDEINHPVDIVIDLSYSRVTSLDMCNHVHFSTLRYLDTAIHYNRRLIFVTGGDEFIGLIMAGLQRVAPRTARLTYFVETPEQVEEIIQQYNQAVPPAYY